MGKKENDDALKITTISVFTLDSLEEDSVVEGLEFEKIMAAIAAESYSEALGEGSKGAFSAVGMFRCKNK